MDLSKTTPLLFKELSGPPFPNAPPEALAVGVDPDKIGAYLGDQVTLDHGVLEFSGPRAREVIMGDLAADAFEGIQEVGSTVTVAGEPMLVVARIRGESDFDRISSNAVLMPLKTAQEIFQQPASISTLLITAPQLQTVAPLARGIRERAPTLDVVTQEEIAESLDDALADQREFFAIINGTVYIVAAIVVAIVMVMAVTERPREIGVLRAIGSSRTRVLSTIVLEAVVHRFSRRLDLHSGGLPAGCASWFRFERRCRSCEPGADRAHSHRPLGDSGFYTGLAGHQDQPSGGPSL